MRKLGVISVCLLAVICAVGAFWKFNYPTYAYRYRLTLAIELDGKVYTGSSVIGIVWASGPTFGDVGPFHPRTAGQAVLIDLGTKGTLIAALSNGESYGPAADGALSARWIAAKAFGNNSTNDELPKLPHLKGRRDLAPDNMPRLVWFRDVADPATAKKVRIEDIPKLLGPTAHLAAAYVEITQDPIVIDIDKKLTWYQAFKNPRNHGVIYLPDGFALSETMFIGDAS
jgi:hypothetical protein